MIVVYINYPKNRFIIHPNPEGCNHIYKKEGLPEMTIHNGEDFLSVLRTFLKDEFRFKSVAGRNDLRIKINTGCNELDRFMGDIIYAALRTGRKLSGKKGKFSEVPLKTCHFCS